MRSFIFCIHPQISLGRSNHGEWSGRGMGEERKVYKILLGIESNRKPEAKMRRWDQNGY
jgi:hypothetical protein